MRRACINRTRLAPGQNCIWESGGYLRRSVDREARPDIPPPLLEAWPSEAWLAAWPGASRRGRPLGSVPGARGPEQNPGWPEGLVQEGLRVQRPGVPKISGAALDWSGGGSCGCTFSAPYTGRATASRTAAVFTCTDTAKTMYLAKLERISRQMGILEKAPLC